MFVRILFQGFYVLFEGARYCNIWHLKGKCCLLPYKNLLSIYLFSLKEEYLLLHFSVYNVFSSSDDDDHSCSLFELLESYNRGKC